MFYFTFDIRDKMFKNWVTLCRNDLPIDTVKSIFEKHQVIPCYIRTTETDRSILVLRDIFKISVGYPNALEHTEDLILNKDDVLIVMTINGPRRDFNFTFSLYHYLSTMRGENL